MKSNKGPYILGAAMALVCIYISNGQAAPWRILLMSGFGVYLIVSVFRYINEVEKWKALSGSSVYTIGYDALPVDRLLIGRGFMWMPEHASRVSQHMTDKKLLEEGEALGGLSFIHGVGINDETDVHVPLEDLVGHMVVIGTTRVGKTRGYEVTVAQAIKRGEVAIVFDPKGDEELLNRTVEVCRRYGREKDFVFFALPYPKFSYHYNPLRNFTIPNEIPDRVAMLLPAGGDSESFRSFAWQVISVITNALLYLNKRPNIRMLSDYSLAKTEDLFKLCVKEALFKAGKMYKDTLEELEINNADVEEYKRLYVKTAEIHHKAIDDLLVLIKHPKEHFQKMTASLTPLLSKLSTGEVGTLLSEPGGSGDIDWERVVKNNKVVYMYFGSLLMRDTSRAVTRMAMQDLISFVGSRYAYLFDKRPINVFIDEFTEVVDNSFINFLNKAGGAGVRVILASQSVADLEAELRASAKAQQIFDNLNTKLWLRISDLATAQVFSDAVGDAPMGGAVSAQGFSVTPEVSDNDIVYKSSYSYNTSKKPSPLVDPSWLLKLPKGQGFLLSRGRVYKVRIPLLPPCGTDYLREIGVKSVK